MNGFFKGWRRKTGMVTLVIPCAVMVAWMRSLLVVDEVLIRKNLQGTSDGLVSVEGSFGRVLSTSGEPDDEETPLHLVWPEWYSRPGSGPYDRTLFGSPDVEWTLVWIRKLRIRFWQFFCRLCPRPLLACPLLVHRVSIDRVVRLVVVL